MLYLSDSALEKDEKVCIEFFFKVFNTVNQGKEITSLNILQSLKMSKLKLFAVALILFSNTAVAAVNAQSITNELQSSESSILVANAGIGASPVAKNGLAKLIWEFAKFIIITVITWGISEKVADASESARHRELEIRIERVESAFYAQTGSYVPVNERSVSLMMNAIGAEPEDRSFVSQKMSEYPQ